MRLLKVWKKCRHVGHNSGRSDILTVFSVVNYTNVGEKEILTPDQISKTCRFIGNDRKRNIYAPAVSVAAQTATTAITIYQLLKVA